MPGTISIFRRLHFRIAAFVIATILVIFGIFLAYQLYSYKHKLTRLELEASTALCQTLTSSLEIAMLNSDMSAIQHSLDAVSGTANIIRVFLLDTLGQTKATTDRRIQSSRFQKGDEGCRNCHLGTDKHLLGTIINQDNEQILRVVTPIVNKPQCHSCHGNQSHYNGVLVMDRSLKPVKAEIFASLRLAIVAAAVAGLLMMWLFRWYIRKHVIDRVVYLESLARRVASSELDVNIRLGGDDELASLAQSVSNMRTALKSSIDQIGNHHNYLRNLIENLIDGILIIDDKGCVAYANKSVADILGLDHRLFRGGAPLDFVAPPLSRIAPVGAMITSAQAAAEPVKEVLVLRDDACLDRHVEIHAAQLVLPPWLRPEVIVVFRDVTTRIEAEIQAYQSERLATVGRLAAGIAHEINNPMASILTCAEGLLRVQGSGDEGRREYLQVIKNSAQRCRMITQKLLDYSAASAPTMEPVQIEQVLQESVSLLKFEAGKKKLELAVRESGPIPMIHGSKDSLVQVFVNLILNSVQAVDVGGRIEVSVAADSRYVFISVVDDGPGISPANLRRVFEPFFTTKPVGMGTGLGLSVSKGIVEHHGGTIAVVESRRGRTCFRVALPIPGAASAGLP